MLWGGLFICFAWQGGRGVTNGTGAIGNFRRNNIVTNIAVSVPDSENGQNKRLSVKTAFNVDLVGSIGLEPTTPCMSSKYSNQLS